MNTQEFLTIDTVVIGGGQAGLSVSYLSKSMGCPMWFWIAMVGMVVEKPALGFLLLGYAKLAMPASDFPYNGPEKQGFMGKDDIVKYVEDFAKFVDPHPCTAV